MSTADVSVQHSVHLLSTDCSYSTPPGAYTVSGERNTARDYVTSNVRDHCQVRRSLQLVGWKVGVVLSWCSSSPRCILKTPLVSLLRGR